MNEIYLAFVRAAGGLVLSAAPPAVSADDTLDEIVVTASLRPTSVADLPQSVTVLDARHAARAPACSTSRMCSG